MSGIDLWLVPWADLTPEQTAYFTSLLTPDERHRMARYRIADDQMRFGLTRGMLRHLSGLRTDGPLDITERAKGKPYWSGKKDLSFNVSHSGDWCAIALSDGAEIGVDVQVSGRSYDFAAMAETAFAPDEQTRLASTLPEAQEDLFFRLWTLREAALKATGEGLFSRSISMSALPLPDFDIWAKRQVTLEGAQRDVAYYSVRISDTAFAAVCVLDPGGKPPELRIHIGTDLPGPMGA